MNQTLHEQLTSAVEQSLSAQTPGAAVAVRLNGETLFETGVGYQDLNGEAPMLANANFYIYSVTKSLLAIASLYLVSQEILDLDAPAQFYLPDLPLNTSITLRHLLSHTSGLPDYGNMPAYFDAVKASPTEPWSRTTFLDLAQTQVRFPPGKGWAYSNIGYLVLRCILERVTGLSMQQLLSQVIFSPLSLQRTFASNTLSNAANLTPGYTKFWSGDMQNMAQIYHPGWVAHGVVVSTAPELVKIIDALFLNKILNSSFVQQMLCPIHILGKYPLFEKLAYGLGLFIDLESPYGKVAGHTGEGPGYSAAAFSFPKLAGCRVTIVAIANQDKPDHGLVMVYRMAEVLKIFLCSK